MLHCRISVIVTSYVRIFAMLVVDELIEILHYRIYIGHVLSILVVGQRVLQLCNRTHLHQLLVIESPQFLFQILLVQFCEHLRIHDCLSQPFIFCIELLLFIPFLVRSVPCRFVELVLQLRHLFKQLCILASEFLGPFLQLLISVYPRLVRIDPF